MRGALLSVIMAIVAITPTIAEAGCVTPAQLGSIIHFAMPVLAKTVVGKCAPILPAGSYLIRSGPDLIARYPEAQGLSPELRSALGALGGTPIPKTMSDGAIRGAMSGAIGGMVSDKLTPSICTTANQVMETLDPLPPANTERLVTMLAELGAKKDGKLDICKPGDATQ